MPLRTSNMTVQPLVRSLQNCCQNISGWVEPWSHGGGDALPTRHVVSVTQLCGRCVVHCGRVGRVFPTLHAMWRGYTQIVSCKRRLAVTRRRDVPGVHTSWQPRVSGKRRHSPKSFPAMLINLGLLFTWAGVHAVVSPGERQGLVNLYTGTNGPGWTGITQGWHNHTNASVDPCDPPETVWSGLICNGATSIKCV
jgi:hypothetical protein